MKEKTVNRNSVIMLSRVLGTIFIVLCHIIAYYSFIPMSGQLGQFLNCGVQLFLFVSGYLYGGKVVSRFGKWYIKRIVVVALPAVFVSVFTIIALIIAGQTVPISTIIMYLFNAQGLSFLSRGFNRMFYSIGSLGPLWFTTVIMICYAFVPLLQKITGSVKEKNYNLFIMFFAIIGIVICSLTLNYIIMFYFLYFFIGYFLGKINFIDKIKTKGFLIYTVVFIVMLLLRFPLKRAFDESDLYLSFALISHFVIGTWFIALIAFLNKKFPIVIEKLAGLKIVRVFDKYSYFVFLTHGVFCMGLFDVYRYFSLPLATVLFCVCTVVATIILKYISVFTQKLILK